MNEIKITFGKDSRGIRYYIVVAPFRKEAVEGWRQVVGRRFDDSRKANLVPVRCRRSLEVFLTEYYSDLDWQIP